MKNLFTMLFVILTITSFAQRKIKVHEENEKIGSGTNNALVATIYESNKDNIEKAWKKLMKDYGAKVNMKKEIFADDATIKDLSSNTCDLFAFVRKVSVMNSKLLLEWTWEVLIYHLQNILRNIKQWKKY